MNQTYTIQEAHDAIAELNAARFQIPAQRRAELAEAICFAAVKKKDQKSRDFLTLLNWKTYPIMH